MFFQHDNRFTTDEEERGEDNRAKMVLPSKADAAEKWQHDKFFDQNPRSKDDLDLRGDTNDVISRRSDAISHFLARELQNVNLDPRQPAFEPLQQLEEFWRYGTAFCTRSEAGFTIWFGIKFLSWIRDRHDQSCRSATLLLLQLFA